MFGPQCDQERPICGQCQKSRRECGGYRDSADTMFRNHSQQVLARMYAFPQSVSGSSSNTSSTQLPHGGSAGAGSMPKSPAVDQDTACIDFFVNQFACGGITDSRSNMFWIPPNFHGMLNNDSLRFSVQCVGAMAMARLKQSPQLVQEAQKKYSQALLSLSDSWRQVTSNPQKDMAFFVILLLGFFEVLATYGPSARKSWITHLGGINALFKNNEDYYCGSPFGARMFFHARSQMILVALQTKTQVADAFAKPNPRVLRAVPPKLKDFFDADILLIRLADIQARCRSSQCPKILLRDLDGLNSAFIEWTVLLPRFWSHTSHEINRPSGLWWDVKYNTYSSPIIEHTLNKVRAALIIIHDLARDIIWISSFDGQKSYPAEEIRWISDTNVPQLVIDICSSVPICFRRRSMDPTPRTTTDPPPLGVLYWLLWPLDVVGSMREASPELRLWVIDCFERIHSMTGNIRASTLANKLRVGQRNFDVSLSYPKLLNLER